MDLYTIGHSKHPIDKFIQLLKDHKIEVLVDVRSTPYSRFNPQFNKNALQQALQKQNIEYVYAGEDLGGRPKDPLCYKHHAIPDKVGDYLHEVNFSKVMKRPWFLEGIQQLLEVAGQHTTSILCSEENPANCHRHHLITGYLMREHPEVTILHIRGDGSVLDAKSIHCASDQLDAEQLSI
jgi:uncharacterized protein (DUF488 family)